MLLQYNLVLVLLSCCFGFTYTISQGDCDFERDICLWTNAKGDDQFDWTRRKGQTPSPITGPNRDHTTGYGRYLYIETSSPRIKGQVARLISPRMRGPQCMMFWYQMHGLDMGRLEVHVNNGSLHLLWLKGNEQGHYWHKARINIRETGEYKVEITGVRGKGFRGDAAIDDISFYPGTCKEEASPLLYAYADFTLHGLMDQQGLPSPSPRSFQYSLYLSQEPFDIHDNFYLICNTKQGLKIVKTDYIPRQPFPCEPRDFFFSSNTRREGLHSFFVIDRGHNHPQTVSLKNDTSYCDGQSKVIQLYASSIDLYVNLAHSSTVLQSSQVPGFPPTLAVDDNHLTCANTLKQENPWMEVKLDGSRFVYKIYVTSRQNCSHEYSLPNITVTIYDQNVQVSCQTTDRRSKKTSRAFLCQPPLRANKVRLEVLGEQTELTICEVIINAAESLEHLRGVRAETWRSISHSNQIVTFLTSPKRHDAPDISKTLAEFMDYNSRLNYYGERLTAFIQTPSDGRYKFYAMSDDQCKVWTKGVKQFSDVTFFEDLEYEKQGLWQLMFVTKYTGYRRWAKYSNQMRFKTMDSCYLYMLEGVVKDGNGNDYIGVGWRKPNGHYNRPLKITKMFWILPVSYRLCCHGIYCPSCRKFVRLGVLGITVVLNSSLSTTCEWYNYTRNFVIENHPGRYDIKVLDSRTNTSTPTERNLGGINVKARALAGCLYNDNSCSWTIRGDRTGDKGWYTAQQGHHFEAQVNTTAWLQSPSVQPQSLYRSIGLCLIFSYRTTNESSQLEVIANTLYNKTTLWRLKGIQGSQWKQAKIPWPVVGISQIIIKGKAAINGSVALSNIGLLTMRCSITPKHATPGYACRSDEFQCNNGVCIKSILRCDGDYACVDNSDESNCACQKSEYKCPDGKCLAVIQLCNGHKDCEDGSDERSCGNPCQENQFSCLDGSCVPWSITCDGVWDCQDGSDEPDICSSMNCSLNDVDCAAKAFQSKSTKKCQAFRGPCNFEYGLCGLIKGTLDQRVKTKWQIKKGPTLTVNTGPDVDHTRKNANGSYLYLEASGLDSGSAAEISSDWLKYDKVTCLQFWYHMWGDHVGELNVYVMTNQTKTMVWNRTGAAGQKWRFGQTPIYNNGSAFKVQTRCHRPNRKIRLNICKFIFEATAGNGNEGDIALDDIDLITGECDFPNYNQSSCKFEYDFCKWQSNDGWIVQTEETDNTDIPIRDIQSQGIARINPVYVDTTPTMISPTLLPQNGFKCLHFWFYSKTTASIRLYEKNSSNRQTQLWFNNRFTRSWTYTQLPLQKQYKYQLMFQTSTPVHGVKLVLAIDDITLTRENCQRKTSMNENCAQHTTAGDCCVFPFVYKDKCYTYCIGDTGADPWCSITDNYDRDGRKGTCLNGNKALQAPVAKPPCKVLTENGTPCVFPFRYRGLSYTQCISAYRPRPWCGTTSNTMRWGYCDAKSLDQCGLCKQKTTRNQCCVFPFVYKKKKYYSCTTSYFYRYWCSLTAVYDSKTKLYGVCKGHDNPHDCKAIYGKQKRIPQWTIDPVSSKVTWSPRIPSSQVMVYQGSKSYILSAILKQGLGYLKAGLFEVSFNGSYPDLFVPNIPNLKSFTACVWIQTNDKMNEGTVFKYKVPSKANNITGFGLINYKKILIRMLDKQKFSGVSANDGKWHHLCLVWNSKGGVYQMYKDSKFVVHGYNWYKNSMIPGGGILRIAADGFLGKLSALNIWTVAMSSAEIAQRAVGCGTEIGDIVDWSNFSYVMSIRSHLVYPPSCLDAGGNGYSVTKNTTTSNIADLRSNVFNSSLTDYSTSFCFHFRYKLIGQAARSLKVYRSEMRHGHLDVNTSSDDLVWTESSKIYLPLWKFGSVSLTTLGLYTLKVRAVFGPGQGSIGLAGYYIKSGSCSKFSQQESKACQVKFTSHSGTFSSPYYPDPYPNSVYCKWWITRSPGYVIRLKFLSFDLEATQSCTKDYLIVYDGQTVDSDILGRFCGDSFPLLLDSSFNSLLVVFKSDNASRFSGFKISYSSYKKESAEACNRIENCPSSCTCAFLKVQPKQIIIYCKGLTALPMKTPVNTFAMMLSENRVSRIEYSISSNLQYMDLSHNVLMSVASYCFTGLKALKTLRMNFNFITELHPKVFAGLSSLEKLDLSNNLLSTVKNQILDDVRNLQVLSLRSNRISRIESKAFKFVSNLTYLYLQHNRIETLSDGLFDSLTSLKVLYLNNNKLKKVTKDTFRNLQSLEVLYLDNNNIQDLDETTFSHLQNLRKLKLDRFVFCCYATKSIKDLTCKSPSSAFSSCDDLMKSKPLQICIWILGILAFLGNIGVIIWRIIVKERNRVHSFLLTNLAVSDLMMGIYLLIIAIKDVQFRGNYFKHDLQWRSSRMCQIAGAVSVISSEVSVLILTTITADRYSSIVFAFKFKRLKMKSAVFVVSLIWIVGFLISLVPTLYTDYFYDYSWQVGFYGRSGVCLPLQLSQDRLPGWEYSAAIFIGLNFIAFSFILVAYIIMFWKVRSAGRSVRSTQMNTESAMARKMAFIILTDFCCWMPIIVIGVLSLLGRFPDPEKLAYVWIAVFVLPVNSSINPVLYTFSNRTWWNRRQDESVLSSVRHCIKRAISRGPSRVETIEMTTCQSVLKADESFATTMTVTSMQSPSLHRDSSGNPRIYLVEAKIFKGELSPSINFYQNYIQESKKGSMFLLKHFLNEKIVDWSSEVEVMNQLRRDGSHHNIIRCLWHSQADKAPISIELEAIKKNSFLICYDLVSSTTLEDYLTKPVVVTQILLAIATDVIDALSYLERCGVRHNHVTTTNILIQESTMVPSIKAVLGGFGQATLVNSLKKTNNDINKNKSNNDIQQYGNLLDQLVVHSPCADPDNQIKEISRKCQQETDKVTALSVRDMIEEVWDGTGTWDTLL